jgi:hypothetical protein
MRLTQPTGGGQAPPYNVLKIYGCSDTNVGFDLIETMPTVSARRYANKVLVHECVSIPQISPMELLKVEFLATADSCYSRFEVFKSSETVDTVPPSITLTLDDYDLVTSILVSFDKDETCCLPLRLAYRLYGYTDDDSRVLLSNGNLLVTPCECPDDIKPVIWKEVQW